MNLYLRLIFFRFLSSRRSRLSMWDTAVTPFRVTLSDLDLLGHVNNSKYPAIMDLARIDLMMRSGWWDKFRRKGWFPVVAGQTITYRKSLKLGQRFDVESRILGMDERWFYVQQVFRREDTVYAHALVRVRFLKKSSGSVEHDEMGEFVGGFPDSLDVPEWIRQWTAATKDAV
ncbi:acyl-CoA thioesterase [Demequina lutea]|uniref:YbgC/YbaW family acyl-CoA thioester hydrolase n=1 Tax=Demequina lutea TaxID=431489 RepID=A0A7Y9ZB27_9MICO|nr:acyl-CoA thioesterase [Demequina lutea]NYI42102.1 YbgC/YbaW family acyl-CoA thioester hydrolase [Demequina lutea]